MGKNYGLPYMGSKNKIAEWVVAHIPQADTLVADLKEKTKKNKEQLRQYLLDALKASGLTQSEVQRRLGTQMAGHYFGRSQWEFPTREFYEKMQELCESLERLYGWNVPSRSKYFQFSLF